jgi:hypothetical protein
MHIRWEPLLFGRRREKEDTMNNQNTYICEYMNLLFIGSRDRANTRQINK